MLVVKLGPKRNPWDWAHNISAQFIYRKHKVLRQRLTLRLYPFVIYHNVDDSAMPFLENYTKWMLKKWRLVVLHDNPKEIVSSQVKCTNFRQEMYSFSEPQIR